MNPCLPGRARWLHLGVVALLASCGGGGGGDEAAPAPPPAASGTAFAASGPSPMDAACTGGSAAGTVFIDAEVEPFVAVNPLDGNHLVGAWQQDRWSNGGARGVTTGVSFDGGRSWTRALQPFSRCAGGTGLSGDYERATDPWVDFAPDGTVHAMGLAFNGQSLQAGSMSAMLATRSTDGGRSWSTPALLVRDGETLFNDKNTLTADRTDARYVYAVWDRLDTAGHGPTLLARSVDGGASWEPARVIYTPTSTGVSQTLGNRIVVLANGTLVDVFTQIDTVGGTSSARIAVLRSTDKGTTWGAPVFVADARGIGARDPQSGQAIRDGALLPTVTVAADGTIWVAWQDARFSGGARDAIAVSRSTDGGNTWSAPVAVNKNLGVAAFTPTLAARADGTVALLHYDLRTDDRATATPASTWLLTTRDGITWTETAVLAPFDLSNAPDSRGLFLGDYQGLVAASGSFVPLIGVATGGTINRTDIVAVRMPANLAASPTASRAHRAVALHARLDARADAQLRAGTHAAIVRAMERRVPGWAARVGAGPP